MKTRNILRSLAAAAVALPSALFAIDTDADGLDDAVETNTGVYVSPANTDTKPNNPDSDGDGAGDWYEVAASYTNPNNGLDKPNIPYPLPAPDSSPPAANKPVKVFILSGQSNMVGQGNISPRGTAGTLETITRDQHKFPNLLNGANWSVRSDDERIWGLDPTKAASSDPYKVPLSAAGTFSYTRRARALTELDFTIWTSTNLVDWTEDSAASQTPGPPTAGAIETVAVTLGASPADGRLFVRVRAAE